MLMGGPVRPQIGLVAADLVSQAFQGPRIKNAASGPKNCLAVCVVR